MSADPGSDSPQHDERTRQALGRLSRVIWRSLLRLDHLEREAQHGAVQEPLAEAEGDGAADSP